MLRTVIVAVASLLFLAGGWQALRSADTGAPVISRVRQPSTGGGIGARPLELFVGPVHVRVSVAQRRRIRRLDPAQARRAARRIVASVATISTPRASERRFAAPSAAERLLRSLRSNAATLRLGLPVQSVRIDLPAIRQAYRNNCETAALAIMLGGEVDQRRLQASLPLATPYAPRTVGGGIVWGDPQKGFVGDVRGGGYGVYEKPLLRLARHYQPSAIDLTRTSVGRVLAALDGGRPVIAWIALGASLPRTWRTPAGRIVAANFAEHTIVLNGRRGRELSYIDPWDGRRKSFTRAQFARLWRELGRRAIAGEPLL